MTFQTIYHGPESSPAENQAVGEFVSQGIYGVPDAFEKYCTMAVLSPSGELIAGTVYHNWHPDAGVIELSSFSLSKRWLTRPVIRAMFALPFACLGCQLVVLRVSERNKSMCEIARTFGFTEVYIARTRGRDEGEFVFSFTDDQWASSRYNKEA